MEITPLKKAEEPVLYKGLKGVYVYKALGVFVITLILFVITGSLNVGFYTKAFISLLIVTGFFMIIDHFKRKSKNDFYAAIRKRCKRKVSIIKR